MAETRASSIRGVTASLKLRWAAMLLLAAGAADATTYYWNRNAVLTSDQDLTRAYNWTANANGTGAYPTSTTDDDFTAGTLNSKWTCQDADANAGTGTCSVLTNAGQLTLNGAGADVWNANNAYTAVYRKDLPGNFDVSVKVVSLSNSNANAKAGIFVANDFTDLTLGGTAYVAVTPSNGVYFIYDASGTVGQMETSANTAGITAPCWLRLVKNGYNITAYYKTAIGNAWTQVGTAQNAQSAELYNEVALFHTSHVAATAGTAVFDDFQGGTAISGTGYDLSFAGSGANHNANGTVSSSVTAASLDFTGYTGTVNFGGQNGLFATYYDDVDFTTTSAARVDTTIAFSWAGVVPDAGLSAATSWSAIWEGYVQPNYSEAYTFYVQADYGERLWVNGVLLIDNWYATGVPEKSGVTAVLTAGTKYLIHLEMYHQATATAQAYLKWSSASQAKEIIPKRSLFAGNFAVTGNVNMGANATVAAGDGAIDFSGTSGTQVFTPRSGATHPRIVHSGASTLQLSTNNLTAIGFSQSAGTLDLNSMNITTAVSGTNRGDFSVWNGTSSSFTNLGGTLTVQGNASFAGQAGNLINLNPGSAWTLAVTGMLNARYANIGNCNASVTAGQAYKSTDAGSNSNWTIGTGTFYWNRNNIFTSSTDPLLAYNWTSVAGDAGYRPTTSLDDNFDNNTLGASWTFSDADADSSTGTYGFSGGQLILSGRGADKWAANNKWSMIYRSDITGGFDVSVKVVSLLDAGSGKAGITVANDFSNLGSGGYLHLAWSPGAGVVKLEVDSITPTTGQLETSHSSAAVSAPVWLRLVRNGTSFYAYYKTSLTAAWTQIGNSATTTITPATDLKVGLFTVSGSTSTTRYAVFDDFQASSTSISTTDDNLSFNGTGTNHNANATMAASQSVKSIDFHNYAGTFDFGGSNTLTVNGGDCYMDYPGTFVKSTGTIAFTSSSPQVWTPTNALGTPNITQNGSGGTTITGRSANITGTLTITNGTLNLGASSSLSHNVVTLTINGGGLDFGGASMNLSAATADFTNLSTLTAGTGTLKFTKSSAQTFTPKSGATFPAIVQSGTGTTTVTANALTAGALSMTAGTWNWGAGLTSSVTSIATAGASSATMAFNTGTVNVTTGNVDLSGLTTITNTSGTLGFTATSGTQTFTPLSGATHPAIAKSGAGTVTVATNALTAGALSVGAGTWNWGSGFTHTVPSLTTTGGTMTFNTSNLQVTSGNADFSGLSALNANTGTVTFQGTGTQVLKPLSGGTHPNIVMTGTGTLQLSTNALSCLSYTQSAGILDFNSQNLTTTSSGNFAVTNGTTTMFTNLGGRTITVAGTASFAGQNGNHLDLNPASAWTIASTGALTASYADLMNSTASVSRGSATNTSNGGANVNWTFQDFSTWTYSAQINFNTTSTGANVSGNVTNFPMLIRLDSNNFVFTQAMVDGRDIRFTDPDGSALSYEIERYDYTNKKALIWVKVPQVDGNSNQDYITMYWGNSAATSLSLGSSVFSAYALAYHLNDDPNGSAPQYTDASGNSNSGTAQNKASTDSTAALIQTGYKLDGTANKYISTTTQFNNPNTFTASIWFKGTTLSGGKLIEFGNAQTGANAGGAFDRMLWMDNTGKISFGINNGSNRVLTTTPAYNDGAWHNAVGRLSASGMYFYIDGTIVSSAAHTTAINQTGYWRVGYDAMTGWTPLPTNSNFTGTVDEPRVAASELSADWIKLSYETQKPSQITVSYPNSQLSTFAYSTRLYVNTTISGAGVQGDVTNFPLLVRLNNSNFNFAQAKSDGGDLRFADSTGVLLPYEIERYDATSKLAEIWVLIPTVEGNNNSQWFRMYWGKSTATSMSSPSSVFTASNGYVGVWHLNGAYTDATSYGNNGTQTATSALSSANIAAGRTFDGSTSTIDVGGGTTGSSLHATGTVTVEAWANSTTLAASQKIFLKPFTAQSTPYCEYELGIGSGGSKPEIAVNTGGTNSTLISRTVLSTATWYHLTGVYDGSFIRIYLNGAEDSAKAVTGNITDYAQAAKIGANPYVGAQTWNGSLDEIRVSNVARSADWAKLSYQTQKSGATTVQIGNRPGDFSKSAQFNFNTTSTGAYVHANVTNIPILVNLTSSNFDFSVTDSLGRDLQFIDKDGTYLYHEIQEWDKGNKVGKVWVRVPQVDSNSSTDYIKLYYGCSACTGAPYAVADSVWSAFAGVYHLNNAFEGRGKDATHFGNHLSFNLDVPNTTGLVTPLAPYFDGVDGSYFAVGDPAGGDLDVGTGDFTINCWVKTSQAAGANTPRPMTKYQTSGPTGYSFVFGTSGSNPGKAIFEAVSAGTPFDKVSTSTLNDGSWHLLTGTKSAAGLKLYVDGLIQGSALAYTGGSLDNTGSFSIANSTFGSDGFQGNVSQAFVIKSALDSNFIKLMYQNQKSGSTLFSTPVTTSSFSASKVYKLNTTSTGVYTTTDVFNYPLLVRLTGSTVIGACQAGGADLRFMGSDGTWLDYSIERWKSTSPESAEVWVKMPVVHANSNADYFTMYYNDVTNGAVPDGQCASCVFDGNYFKGVYHMNDSAASQTVTDVRNAYNGTFLRDTYPGTNTNTNAHGVYGPIGSHALSFSFASKDWVNLGINTDIAKNVPAVTMSAWIKPANFTNFGDIVFLAQNAAPATTRARFATSVTTGFVITGGRSQDGENLMSDTTTNNAMSAGTWYHVVSEVDYRSDSIRVFVNGVRATALHKMNFYDRTASNTLDSTASISSKGNGSGEWFDGVIDEVRISPVALDSNWVKLDYGTQRSDAAPLFNPSPSDFLHTQKYAFNTTKTGVNISGAVTNYPLLVRLTGASLVGAIRSDSKDIRFLDGDGKTWLNYSVERNNGTDSAEVWVLVPQIDANSSTDFITLYYGEASSGRVPDGQCATCVFSTANNFQGVYHLNGTFTDATGNANNGTDSGSAAGIGVIAASRTFNGTSSYISLGNPASLGFTTNITFSAWVRWTSSSGQPLDIIAHGDGGSPIRENVLRMQSGKYAIQCYDGSNHGAGASITGDSATWVYVSATYDGTKYRGYRNGVLSDSSTDATGLQTVTTNWAIGAKQGGTGRRFTGQIDEPRIADAARSGDWFKLDYETQKRSASAFWTTRSGPDNIATLTASATNGSGINLSWSGTVSDSSNADSVGIWVKYNAYPDSANALSTTFVVKRPKTESTYVYPATYPATYYFGLAVRNTSGAWSPITSSSSDTAVYTYDAHYSDTIYVDTAIGSSGNTCTQAKNPATPFAAVEDAVACSNPASNVADTLVIRVMPGNYTGSTNNDFIPLNSVPTVIASFDKNSRAVLNSATSTAYTARVSSFVTLRNLDIKAANNHATGLQIISGADSDVVDGVRIYNASAAVVHDTGIVVVNSGSDRILITNTAIVQPKTMGIYAVCENLFNVINNVFYGPGTTGSRALKIPTDVGGSGGLTVTNNIFYNWDYADDDSGQVGSGVTTSNNLFYMVTSGREMVNATDANKVLKDPLFYTLDPLNPSAFKLLPGSPAIDAGTTTIDVHSSALTRVPTSDAFGSARTIGTAPDIGLYEGSGYTGTPTSDFDTLITATIGNRCIVKNSKWKIVFDMARGGGIDSMMDVTTDSTANLVPSSSLLFDVKIDSYSASAQTTNNIAPTFSERTKARAVVRQRLAVSASEDLNVYYSIYPSGHIYVQSEISNLSSSSTLAIGTLDYILKLASSTATFNGVGKNGAGFLTTSSRDAAMAVTQDLDLGAGSSSETWTYSTTTGNPGNVTVNTANLVDLPINYKRQHHFLLYIGDNSLNANKTEQLYADAYSPSPVSLSSGSLLHERSWQDGLIGHWTFDDGSGSVVKDKSVINANNAVVSGTTWTTGKVGGAMHFPTTGMDSLTTTSAMDPTSPFSVMFWVKPTFGSMGDTANVLTKGTGTTGWHFRKTSGANSITFKVGTTSLTTPTLTDGVWTHIAGTISGTRVLSLYVNGALVGSSTSAATITTNSTDMRMGGNSSSGKLFAGDLDDIRVYGVEVVSGDIQSVYNRGFSNRYGDYHLRADNNNRIVALLNESAAATRIQPAFQIDNWYGTRSPKYVYLNGSQLRPNVDYVADSVGNGMFGSYLVLQLNKTLTGASQTLFIDDDDSTGSAGVASAMKALTITATSGDKIAIRNFSDTVFGSATGKQWNLEVDLNGWTTPTATNATVGFGEINVWNAGAVNPGVAISGANNEVGLQATTGRTLAYLQLDATSPAINSAGKGYNGPATLGYTVVDSSATRLSLVLDTISLQGQPDGAHTDDIKLIKRVTIYPTGRVFYSYSVTGVDYDLGDPDLFFMGRYANNNPSSAWGGTYGKANGRMGRKNGGNLDFHSYVGGILSIKSANATTTTISSMVDTVTGISAAPDGNNDYKGNSMDLAAGLFQAADDNTTPITINFALDISTNFTDSATADSLIADVQTPATISALTAGSTVTNDALDFNTDGFAEGDGAYTYAAGSGNAHFKFVNTVPCFNPAFRISTWSVGTLPEFVEVDNQVMVRGYGYNAFLKSSTSELVIQFNKTFAPGTHVIYISHKTGLAVTVDRFDAVSGDGVDTLKWSTQSEFENLGFNLYRRVKPARPLPDSVLAKLAPKGAWKASAAHALASAAARNTALAKASASTSAQDSTDTLHLSLSPEELKALGYERINAKVIPGAPGGSSASTREYAYVDNTAAFDIPYEYVLEAVDFNGSKAHFGPRTATAGNPLVTELYQNYPNPFNPITTMRFSLKEKTKVSFVIYDSKGRVVRTLVSPDKPMNAGKYRLVWDARSDGGAEVPSGQYFYRFAVPHYVATRKMILVK